MSDFNVKLMTEHSSWHIHNLSIIVPVDSRCTISLLCDMNCIRNTALGNNPSLEK